MPIIITNKSIIPIISQYQIVNGKLIKISTTALLAHRDVTWNKNECAHTQFNSNSH